MIVQTNLGRQVQRGDDISAEEGAMPKKAGDGFIASARAVLARAKEPLTCREIVVRGSAIGALDSHGKTPERTLNKLLLEHIRAHGTKSEFKKVGPGLFELARSR